MGLGAPRKKSKLSYDPNNTAWSRSASKYGQKILQAHGWAPGDQLGARDAAHPSLRTAESASHIQVAVKDDNLGLGAKYGAAQEHGQATGLDMFQDILGRLNGKSTTILAEEQRKRSDLRSSAYIGQRWGSLRFVSGGYLVGDDLREGAKKRNYEIGPSQPAASLTPENDRQPEVNKQATAPLDSSGRRSNRKSNSCGDSRPHTGFRNGLDSILMRNPSPGSFPPEQNLSSDTLIADVGDDQRTLDKARRRAQKAERKLERRRRKDASIQEQNLPDPAQLGADIKEEIAAPHSVVGSTRSKKVLGGHGGSRNAVRQRYIQQKKMALMNNKALNEILMIKI